MYDASVNANCVCGGGGEGGAIFVINTTESPNSRFTSSVANLNIRKEE